MKTGRVKTYSYEQIKNLPTKKTPEAIAMEKEFAELEASGYTSDEAMEKILSNRKDIGIVKVVDNQSKKIFNGNEYDGDALDRAVKEYRKEHPDVSYSEAMDRIFEEELS